MVGDEVKEETIPKAEFSGDLALPLPGRDPRENPAHVPPEMYARVFPALTSTLIRIILETTQMFIPVNG